MLLSSPTAPTNSHPNTSPPTPSTSTMQTSTHSQPSDRTASLLTWKRNFVYSWSTREPWTQMKTGQRGRSRRKMTDTAPYQASSTTSATGRKAAQKSSTRTWKDLIYTSNLQGCDQTAQLSQKQQDQPTHTNLTHMYASKTRAQNILTVANTGF